MSLPTLPVHSLTVEGVNSLLLWFKNVPTTQKFEEVYGPNHHAAYVEEKLPLFSSFAELWFRLDSEHRQRVLDAAKRYAVKSFFASKGYDSSRPRGL